ncbi:hypothetical protein PAL_GLEAN10012532 [Pteropus alecto]|uniref:Immunoglobulin I-set domain-containing protein n=1 Tax=Pteropus alecto TaxID=9402 RepID=L5K9U5_PTEAL|nr:hypothetical protein PAL_GLEAN10012532 [Pteropus alecto]
MSPVTLLQETNALTSSGPHYNVSKDGTLVIAQPSTRDAGAYICTATNTVGFSSQEMRLSVNSECWPPRPGSGARQVCRRGHRQSDLTCAFSAPW